MHNEPSFLHKEGENYHLFEEHLAPWLSEDDAQHFLELWPHYLAGPSTELDAIRLLCVYQKEKGLTLIFVSPCLFGAGERNRTPDPLITNQ